MTWLINKLPFYSKQDETPIILLGKREIENTDANVIENLKKDSVLVDPERKLSSHFQLSELLVTNHRTINNTPTLEVVERLVLLCENFLEPLRDQFGPLQITSGYRSPKLNKTIHGAKQSAHMYGCAADLVPTKKKITITEMVRWVKEESNLNFDQVIDEASNTSVWLHLGMLRPGFEKEPRGEALIFRNGKYTWFV